MNGMERQYLEDLAQEKGIDTRAFAIASGPGMISDAAALDGIAVLARVFAEAAAINDDPFEQWVAYALLHIVGRAERKAP